MADVFNIGLEQDQFNQKIGGGLPKRSIVLVEGEEGKGKSILSQRFSFGALKNDYTVSLISSELTVSSFINQMESLSYDVRDFVLSEKLKVVSLFTNLGDIKFDKNLIYKVFSSKDLMSSDVIIIDSLNGFLIENLKDVKDIFRFVSTIRRIADMGKLVVITFDPKTENDYLKKTLESLSEVFFKVIEVEKYGNFIKQITIHRFNGAGGDVEETIPFRIRSGIGIVIELAS